MKRLTDEQWQEYEADGYFKLGKILSDRDLIALQQRIDDIMLGRADVPYDRMLMQMDSDSGSYADAGVQSKGFKEATLNYRKIQDLEYDPLFLAFMQRPVFRQACERVYGRQAPIRIMRAMFMNKPSNKGTFLPWHQDRWKNFDRDPLLTVWAALDPATRKNGCVEIIPGSHKMGLINPEHPSGFLTEKQAREICKPENRLYLELAAGEVVLLHNWVLHASDVNRSTQSRRAFSVCYMHAATRDRKGSGAFPVVFGEGALTPEGVAPVAAR